MPDDKLVFNDELSMYLQLLDGEPALHVVDTATRFGAAVFLERQDAEHVWAAFLSYWALVNTGHPEKSRTDAAPYLRQSIGNTYMNRTSSSYKLVEWSLTQHQFR
jgi:hypothetical protein